MLGGRYQVLKPLAKGGMAEVLLARTVGIKGFERFVVIKRIRVENGSDAKSIEMFLDEARLVASLHHRNIVQVHDVGEEDGKFFFAMEYVHGEDGRSLLRHVKEKKQQLPLEHVITIVAGAAAGLHYAHEQKGPDWKPLGIVHRDISPGNILIGFDGGVKVVDFGIAKTERQSENTQAGEMKGKLGYMSPEQCQTKTIDRRSDIYLLGIVLYELATVKRLFKGVNRFEVMSAVVDGKIPKPTIYRKDLPPALEKIILKALATKVEDRYQTAEEFRLALEEFATAAHLNLSQTRLGDFMRKQFGERKEPWLEDDLPKAPDVLPIRPSSPITPPDGVRVEPGTNETGEQSSGTPMSWPVDASIARRRAWILGGVGFAAIIGVFAAAMLMTASSSKSDEEPAAAPAQAAKTLPPAPPKPAPVPVAIDAGVAAAVPVDAAVVVAKPPADAAVEVKVKTPIKPATGSATQVKQNTTTKKKPAGDDLDAPLPD